MSLVLKTRFALREAFQASPQFFQAVLLIVIALNHSVHPSIHLINTRVVDSWDAQRSIVWLSVYVWPQRSCCFSKIEHTNFSN